MAEPLTPPSLAAIRAARESLPAEALNTQLVRLDLERAPCEVWLKLENLQPIGSFKLRAAGAALAAADPRELARGVVTASAGNMAQAVAWHARRRSLPCRVFVPEAAPAAKLDAARRYGAEIERVPYDDWWNMLVTGEAPAPGVFVHPVADPHVVAGNGTIGLEIAEALPDVDAVLVPYGGGGLSCGIAAALRELVPGARVHAAEIETAAPLAAALEAGEPVPIDHTPSWVDGIGGKGVLAEMWPMAQKLLAGSIVVSLEHVAACVRLLATRQRIIAEGAGAASVAAALSGSVGGRVVCVVSGGNLDAGRLAGLLSAPAETPGGP